MNPKSKVFLVLRRADESQPFRWWPVRAARMHLPDWKSLDVYTYRDGRIVFAVQMPTGVTLAIGASVPHVRQELNKLLVQHGLNEVQRACREAHDSLNLGPKPKVENESKSNDSNECETRAVPEHHMP